LANLVDFVGTSVASDKNDNPEITQIVLVKKDLLTFLYK
jgi:hypothetical protein